ncbi:MAG: hypothetical protein KKF48_01030 [Nanoarchaeota archaeon]|nr:hypothetical protein [Nanoarchaeota archaeon]MBU1027607.1 hypothetical protein [Nanoarchaeota archaeon]
MFKKKTCKKCGKKSNKDFDYCPYCGNPGETNDDWGMLGKNDLVRDEDIISGSMLGGLGGNMLGKMLNSAMKMLEKEMQKEIKHSNMRPKTNIRLMINGKEIDFNNKNIQKSTNKKTGNRKKINLPKIILKNFSKLPRKEPKANIRRFSDKIVYEIELPKVTSNSDISIVQLENSIEIKAISKNNSYLKLIPINLPITNYDFEKEKLTLEFAIKG